MRWSEFKSGLIVCLLIMFACALYLRMRINHIYRRTSQEEQQKRYFTHWDHQISNDTVEEEMLQIHDIMNDLQFKEDTSHIVYITNICKGNDRFKSQPMSL